MISGFLTMFSYIEENEYGEQKLIKVEEFYQGDLFTEVESYINKIHKDLTCKEDFFIATMQRANFQEIVFKENDEKELFWYKVTAKFLFDYTVSGKPKYKKVNHLILAESSDESILIASNLDLSCLPEYEIVSTTKTDIVQVNLY